LFLLLKGVLEMVVRNSRLIQEKIKIFETLTVPRQCGSFF